MKKCLTLVLSLALMMGLFSACNAPTSTSKSDSSSTSTPAEPEKIVLLIREEWEAASPGEKDVIAEIAKQTGILVEYVKPPAGTYEDTLSLMLAGGDQLDAFIAFNTWTDLASKGYIIPLNDLLNTYGKNIVATQPKSDFSPLTNQKTGEIMALPFGNIRIGNAPRVRKDWLDALGLPVPTDLASFEAMLKAFKESDKFGKNAIPLITSFQFNQLDRAFAGMWIDTGDNRFIDTDGKVKDCVFEPGYKDYIAKMAEWYSKGYIWPEAFVQDYKVINDIVAQDRVGAMATWVSVGLSGYDTLHTANAKAEYVYLDKLTGPKGSSYSLRPAASQGLVISAKSQHKEAVMKLWNWSATDNNALIASYGLEGVHWKWVDKTTRVIERTTAGQSFKGIDTLFSGYGQNTYDSSFASSLWRQQDEFNANKDLVLKVGKDDGIAYDEVKIAATVPSLPDIMTFKDGEIVKFIMGQRKMEDWGKFISELLAMGYDKVIDERTAQYNTLKK